MVMEKNLPRMVMALLGVAGANAMQIGLLEINDRDAIDKLFATWRIDTSINKYDCSEKWSLPVLEGELAVASFISFGVGRGEKNWPKTIGAEINDFCSRQGVMGNRYLAVYFCSNGIGERKIIIASVLGTCGQEISRVETGTQGNDML